MAAPKFEQHREHIRAILSAALKSADPYTAVHTHLKKSHHQLAIGSNTFDLQNGRLFLLSVGKAAVPMAQAALEAIGETAVSGGAVLTKFAPNSVSLSLPVYEGDHPVPGEKSVAATAAVLNTLTGLTKDDLLLCLISGGASALFTRPHLPLHAWQQLNQVLLASGCTIQELNTVRRQLDSVKSGGLARLAFPAKVISLILSDVVGNDLAAIGSGPTVPSLETADAARAVLARYGVLDELETAVAQTVTTTLENLTRAAQLPSNNIINNFVIGSIQQSAQAAAAQARSLGFHTRLLTTRLEGEAREVGRFAAALAKDAPPLSATLLGGETTVTLRGSGIGGRNLETALAAAIGLSGWPQRAIISFATDGDDGNSGMAGATVTGDTVPDKREATAYLNNNDSFTFFARLDATGRGPHLIHTGPTGTNVNDLVLILNYDQPYHSHFRDDKHIVVGEFFDIDSTQGEMIMPVRNASASWEGSLKEGKGSMALGSGRYEGPFTHASRFAEGDGTNPEELIGAAHAGCYSMFLSALLSADDHVPNYVNTNAKVHIGQVDGAPTIHTIELTCEADVPGIDDATFQEYAARAKAGCPVSKALASVSNVQLSATLKS